MADQCGHILTEATEKLACENGDHLVTECFYGNDPGRVWKGPYPYFKPRRNRIPYKPPFSKPNLDYLEEEELMILISTDE